jgi:ribonuclease BN (tRNA processing enzyme)
MRLSVLGACGAWPEAGQACSGYLVEHDGFRLVVDLGYATVPRLLGDVAADQVDAVFVSHGHPDHCADLNPLLRARTFRDDPAPPLPVYALPGALDAVLALDRPQALAGSYALHEFAAGDELSIGPFRAGTRGLPHWLPNAGIRLAAGGRVLAYTGDTGPSPDVVELSRGADLLVAECYFYAKRVKWHLNYPAIAARRNSFGAKRVILTHMSNEMLAHVDAVPEECARDGLVVTL